MRYLIRLFYITAIALFSLSVPLRAEEGFTGAQFENKQQVQKNDCLVVAMNCENQTEHGQQMNDRSDRKTATGADHRKSDGQKKSVKDSSGAFKFENDDVTSGYYR